MTKKIAFGIIGLSLLAGCNTFEGVGKDIEGTGQGLENAATSTKEAIKSPSR